MTDDTLEESQARLEAVARVVAQQRRMTEGHDVRSPSKEDYRVAEPILAALNAISPPVPRPEVQPTFNQIHEAIHMVRKGKFLPDELVQGIILPALRHFSDTCHPETAAPSAK